MQMWLKRLPVEKRMNKQRGGFATSTNKGITTKILIYEFNEFALCTQFSDLY